MQIKGIIKKFLTPDKLRFLLVGFANTAVDLGLLFILTKLGMDVIPANFISTGIAFIFSFFANKNYTFKDAGRASSSMIIKFIVVTLISAWGIQPLVIGISRPFLLNFISDGLSTFGSKCLAIAVGLVWNYTLYAKLVFNKKSSPKAKPEKE